MNCLIFFFFFTVFFLYFSLLYVEVWAWIVFFLSVFVVCTKPSYEPARILIPPWQYITFIILKGEPRSKDFSVSPMETCMCFFKK